MGAWSNHLLILPALTSCLLFMEYIVFILLFNKTTFKVANIVYYLYMYSLEKYYHIKIEKGGEEGDYDDVDDLVDSVCLTAISSPLSPKSSQT